MGRCYGALLRCGAEAERPLPAEVSGAESPPHPQEFPLTPSGPPRSSAPQRRLWGGRKGGRRGGGEATLPRLWGSAAIGPIGPTLMGLSIHSTTLMGLSIHSTTLMGFRTHRTHTYGAQQPQDPHLWGSAPPAPWGGHHPIGRLAALPHRGSLPHGGDGGLHPTPPLPAPQRPPPHGPPPSPPHRLRPQRTPNRPPPTP